MSNELFEKLGYIGFKDSRGTLYFLEGDYDKYIIFYTKRKSCEIKGVSVNRELLEAIILECKMLGIINNIPKHIVVK